jgi:sulfoacetaldehyde dehydrogenase
MDSIVTPLIEKARAAQRRYETYDQAAVDAVVTAAGWAIMEPGRNRALAEMAVRDTGLGVVEDKVTKNHRKTLGLLRDLKGVKSVGVIAEYPELGIVEIARPVGVVAAITPSTNPGATPANKIINALKGRNAVIVAPSPKGASTCAALVGYIHAELAKLGAPPDLVQMLPAPITKEATHALMRQADLVVATGSQPTCAPPPPAARRPSASAPATSPASSMLGQTCGRGGGDRPLQDLRQRHQLLVGEQRGDPRCRVCRRHVRPRRGRGRTAHRGREKPSCRPRCGPHGKLAAAVTAQDAPRIAANGRARARSAARRPLPDGRGNRHRPGLPFSGEKLSPVLTVYRARDFDHACAIVADIYAFQGAGHSVSIHSADDATSCASASNCRCRA